MREELEKFYSNVKCPLFQSHMHSPSRADYQGIFLIQFLFDLGSTSDNITEILYVTSRKKLPVIVVETTRTREGWHGSPTSYPLDLRDHWRRKFQTTFSFFTLF